VANYFFYLYESVWVCVGLWPIISMCVRVGLWLIISFICVSQCGSVANDIIFFSEFSACPVAPEDGTGVSSARN